MSKDEFEGKNHKGDWYFNCDTCGQREWASRGTRLGIYTGLGGAMVCRDCVDAVDPALVPYKIPAERPIPWARPNAYSNVPGINIPNAEPPFDWNSQIPGPGPAPGFAQKSLTIDQMSTLTIDKMNLINNCPSIDNLEP